MYPNARIRTLCVLLLALIAVPPASAEAKRITFGERTLKAGMRGTDVRVLQGFLNRAGIRSEVDGVFGPKTRHKVRRWEKRALRQVDGKVTRRDAGALRAEVEQTAPVAPVPSASLAGGMSYMPPPEKAAITPDGLAVAPSGAPPAVQRIIAAANEIATKPYRYGGGHGKWDDSGYDCSGSVSYALHGADLLDEAMPSGSFMNWGDEGPGQWVTIYAHEGHMYMVVAGLRFDTSGRQEAGTRWQSNLRSPKGFTVRHPPGL